MSAFMASSKSVVLKSQSPDIILETNVATTVALHIYERMQDTQITDILYQLEKVSGRSSEILQAWTDVDMTDVDDNIYKIELTTSQPAGSTLQLRVKIVDIDGIESFKLVNDIKVTA